MHNTLKALLLTVTLDDVTEDIDTTAARRLLFNCHFIRLTKQVGTEVEMWSKVMHCHLAVSLDWHERPWTWYDLLLARTATVQRSLLFHECNALNGYDR